MATEIKDPLTNEWVELGEGPLTVQLISGNAFWVYNGGSAPTTDDNYMVIETRGNFYSYGGSEKTFGKIGEPYSSIAPVKVAVLEIV